MSKSRSVLIETVYCRGTRGSEDGIAEAWIEAACGMPEIEKVFVLTATDRKPKHEKEIVLCVAQDEKHWTRLFFFLKNISLLRRLIGLVIRLKYLLWLHHAANRAEKLCLSEPVGLALHVSFATMLFGTRLGRLKKFGTKIVLCGTLPCPPPITYQRFERINERLAARAIGLFTGIFHVFENVDVFACSNQGTLRMLESLKPTECSERLVLNDPTSAVESQDKVNQAIYVDDVRNTRKGRQILLATLRKIKRSPVPLRILSPQPNDWSAFENVCATPLLPYEQFEEELARSSFVLCTSFREGLNTTVARAASAGAIPIVTPITAFDQLDDSACIKLSAEGDPVEEIARALDVAASLSADQKLLKRENARRWAELSTDRALLRQFIRRHLNDEPN